MNTADRQLRLERGLMRQSVMHHRKREEQLERLLGHVMAVACAKRCDCRTCKELREIAGELEERDHDG